MDKHTQYQRLMIKAAQQKDARVLKYIDKPDPVVEGLLAMLKRKVLALVKVRA